MVQQVRLLNNLLFFIIIVLGCNPTPGRPLLLARLLRNSADPALSDINGIKHLNRQPFSGELFTLFPGTIDTAETTGWLEGREHGEWKKFYEAAKIRQTRTFENGKKTGALVTWWPNGIKQMHYLFKKDEYDGTCREWNEQGQLVKEMNYKNGHEEGAQKSWYDNGSIRANYVIDNGRRYGLLGTKNCMNVSDSIFK